MQALREEVESQVAVLERFGRSEFQRAPKGSIFVGAGDSYAAALAGFYASGGRNIALDPYSLASAPGFAKGLDVYLISVSGRTSANLAAAKSVRGIARKVTAITADEGGRLSSLTDDTVKLPMGYVPKSPGLLSFSSSLLAVLGISKGIGVIDFQETYEAARNDRGLTLGKGTTYFLGNALAYPVALYAAAKTYEFLGQRAHAELLEEFSHLELFSLRGDDAVNIFSSFDPSGASAKLSGALSRCGYPVCVVPRRGSSDLQRLFHDAFVAQISALESAERAGLTRPRFLTAGKRLKTSDEMIY